MMDVRRHFRALTRITSSGEYQVDRYGTGLDIGSTCTKVIVLDGDGGVVLRRLLPTGWSSVDTAAQVRGMLEEKGFSGAPLVATGYGRVSVAFADRCVTEITCHAKGACAIFGEKDLNVIDIGGQDTKLIAIRGGAVEEFVMNDKCSAGTGRFLEVMANTLSVTPGALCEMASRGGGAKISSLCTVFAESEVIGLIGRGTAREDIAYAVVHSIAEKVRSQAGKLRLGNARICLTGGLCDFPYLRETLSAAFGSGVATCPDARYAGALGAALTALSLR